MSGLGGAAFIGEHPLMRKLAETIRRAAPLDTPVIIEGPTGSGKERVAELLHDLSGRGGKFIAVNVASLSDSIADSELFGALRGSYTGADADRRGLVTAAANGTLFLDEAADLSTAVQAKLLRVLDNGMLRPVGGAAPTRIRFRLVVSLQSPAVDLVVAGRWRSDFYYRAAGLLIRVPPLEARRSDIPLLIGAFLQEHGLTAEWGESWAEVLAYPWPGNVRQLRRAVERAAFECSGSSVTAAALHRAVQVEDRLDLRVPTSPSQSQPGPEPPTTLRDAIRDYITSVLTGMNGDTREAARALGLSRSQLYRKMEAFGIRYQERGGGVADLRT
jgi:DNA-binding NtrC family response regulator